MTVLDDRRDLELDARRYQWLRQYLSQIVFDSKWANGHAKRHIVDLSLNVNLAPNIPESLDEVIDKYMNSDSLYNLRCPHCGGPADPAGWINFEGKRGPECEDCGATAPDLETWNKRFYK